METIISKRLVTITQQGGTHDLADNLAGRLNPTPCRDIRARNDFRTRGGHFVNESSVGDDAAVEVDFY